MSNSEIEKPKKPTWTCPQCRGIVSQLKTFCCSGTLAERLKDMLGEETFGETGHSVLLRIQEHMETSLDKPLPKGLVYATRKCPKSYQIVVNEGAIVGGENIKVDHSHSFDHQAARLYGISGDNLILAAGLQTINSKEFRYLLNDERYYSLLSEPEFDLFIARHRSTIPTPLANFGIEKFIRELE